ncbi:MAG: hypothetical protein PVJ39_05820 [Gammaproteobacteria bacterium]
MTYSALLVVLATLLPATAFVQEMDHSTMSHDNAQHMTHEPSMSEHQLQSGHHNKTKPEQREMDTMHHSDQRTSSMHDHSTASTPLQRLDALPPSGKSREAGFDGSYFMQNTALNQPLEVKCALGSRGLIMLDNDTWTKCGGKPAGWSQGIRAEDPEMDHGQHMNH